MTLNSRSASSRVLYDPQVFLRFLRVLRTGSVTENPGFGISSIRAPITDDEKALFNVNQTGLEEEGMKFLRKMVERDDEAYAKFFEAALFPSSFINSFFISKGYTKNGVIRNLKEKGYLEPTDPERKMVNGKREYCFTMTEKLKKWYQEQKIAQ